MNDISRTPRRGAPSAPARVLLRLPPPLHGALQRAAAATGLSFNEYVVRRLSAPAGSLALSDEMAAALAHADALVGARLVGLLVYGSWTRGEAAARSDVDLLVIVEPEVRLTRQLYRRWDESPLRWQGRLVDPHFVHLPAADERPSGTWGEAAVDGVVLFERDFRLSAWLIRVRREIAAGRLVRRTVHGQPYWTAA
jgi:predicted nucleotidyltransferase